jgi:putative methylase
LSARPIKVRKRDLAIKLQRVSTHPQPKVALEQYTIPADLAAEILFSACYVYGDIDGKRVIDLGTGTGRLAIGASLLNAEYVVGVDIDPLSLAVAAKTSKLFGIHVDWVLANAETMRGRVDTVIMNPPFGTRQPHADTKFLSFAVGIGDVIYSIHKSSTRTFLNQWLQKRGYEASEIMTSKMEIPHQFTFHRKERRFVEVCVIRIRRRPKP